MSDQGSHISWSVDLLATLYWITVLLRVCQGLCDDTISYYLIGSRDDGTRTEH